MIKILASCEKSVRRLRTDSLMIFTFMMGS